MRYNIKLSLPAISTSNKHFKTAHICVCRNEQTVFILQQASEPVLQLEIIDVTIPSHHDCTDLIEDRSKETES